MTIHVEGKKGFIISISTVQLTFSNFVCSNEKFSYIVPRHFQISKDT